MKRPVLSIAFLLLAPTAAFAADPPKTATDPAAAQGLFYEARTLMGQNKWTEACPKLEESMRLDPGIGTQFNLADCNEHVGKIASAWAGFLEVAAQSKASNQGERERLARKRAAALESRIPKLVVEVTGAPQGLEVKRDGIAVGTAAWGTPIPVDPGSHRVTATAPGKQPWETTVNVAEAKTARVAVPRDLPNAVGAVAAAPIGAPPAAGVTATPAAADTSAQYFPPPVVEGGSTQRTLGWIITGVGAVGLGVGAGFGLSSLGKRDEARSHCVSDACDATGVGLRDDAMRNGNIATISTIAGGAILAGGIILVLTAPKGSEVTPERAGKVRAVPSFAHNGGGFMLQGAFQ